MDRLVAYAGEKHVIMFARCADLSSPAEEFFDSLSTGEQAKVMKLFEYLGNHGRIKNPEKFKKIEGTEFFEFKSHQIRMPCYFLADHRVVVTHGFRKKGDRIPPAHLERARRIRNEDATRGQS